MRHRRPSPTPPPPVPPVRRPGVLRSCCPQSMPVTGFALLLPPMCPSSCVCSPCGGVSDLHPFALLGCVPTSTSMSPPCLVTPENGHLSRGSPCSVLPVTLSLRSAGVPNEGADARGPAAAVPSRKRPGAHSAAQGAGPHCPHCPHFLTLDPRCVVFLFVPWISVIPFFPCSTVVLWWCSTGLFVLVLWMFLLLLLLTHLVVFGLLLMLSFVDGVAVLWCRCCRSL